MADAKNPPGDKHDEALPRISCSEQNPPQTADSAPQHLKNSHDDDAAQDSVDRPPPLPPPDCNDADVAVESQDPEDLRPQTPRSDQPSSQLPLPTSVPAHDTPSIVATANPLPDVPVQCAKLKPEDDNAVDAKNEVMPLSPRQSPENPKPPDEGQDQEFGDDEPRKFKDDSSVPYLIQKQVPQPLLDAENQVAHDTPTRSFLLDSSSAGDGYESGTEEEQAAFMKDVQYFYKDNGLDFKPPKFYKEELNLLKLWRAVIKLGGYEQVTSCKLWRQVGESFRPPKTCTTVSWTFRIFYEKALLEYEKHKMQRGELPFSDGSLTESVRVENQACGSQALGTGRARRDAAARAMQGWHSQRLLGNGQVFHPIIKDKNLSSTLKGDKQLKTNGLLKRKKPSTEHAVHVGHIKTMKPQGDVMVIDIGPAADWVKINVQKTNDCFEVYALVPGLLREEVHVQSDPAGRLIISGQPEELDNPWGVTPFKKVVSLPTRIDPHQTSAVVTLHGQLFVRVPFEQSDF